MVRYVDRQRVSSALILGALALGGWVPAARAQDRTDPIPARVGGPGGVAFGVNPAVPAGMDAARYLDIAGRSIGRWGDRQAGATDVVPGTPDGKNVLGIHALPAGVLGRTTQWSTEVPIPVPATHVCTASGATVSDQSSVRVRSTKRLKLRRDVLRHGRVRHRTVRVAVARYRDQLRAAPLLVARCRAQRGVRRMATTIETDVELAPSPGGGVWQMGPAKPEPMQWDFETNLLHELGHVSGLGHQRDHCDPLSPMPVGQADGDWWHAADDWNHATCSASPASTPTPGSDSPEAIAPGLGGATIYVNPAVPRDVEPGRWLALAQRIVARAGGRYGGTTSTPPQAGDDTNVIGFSTLPPTAYLWPIQTPVAVASETPQHRTCVPRRTKVRERFAVRRTVRVRGRRLRRDILRARSKSIASYRCSSTAASTTAEPGATELDLLINGATLAWQAGPDHPDDATRLDLETALIQGVQTLSGAPKGGRCDTTTANTSLAFGDWWRSSTDVRRSNCTGATASNTASGPHDQIQIVPIAGTRTSRGGVARSTVMASGASAGR